MAAKWLFVASSMGRGNEEFRSECSDSEPVGDGDADLRVDDEVPMVKAREVEMVGAVEVDKSGSPFLAEVIAEDDQRSARKRRDGDTALALCPSTRRFRAGWHSFRKLAVDFLRIERAVADLGLRVEALYLGGSARLEQYEAVRLHQEACLQDD
jgi:hypothetical protein